MKVLRKDIWAAQRTLGKLARAVPVPIKTSYWVGVRSKDLIKEIEAIEEKRLELVKKYGKEVDDAGQKNTTVPEENMEVFSKEFNAILDTEVELNEKRFKEKFNVEDFAKVDSLTGEDMSHLAFLFNEPK